LLSEFRKTLTIERTFFQKFGFTAPDPNSENPDIDLRRLLVAETRTYDTDKQESSLLLQHKADTEYSFSESNFMKNEPFEFYSNSDPANFPEHRLPAPGITILPIKMHRDLVQTATPAVPETGPALHHLLDYLLMSKYPEFYSAAQKLCRPSPTTNATFEDFNKEQTEFPPVPSSLAIHICSLVALLLNARPFLPLHFVDTFYAKMPLVTGTSYYYRQSYQMKTHAAFSHPIEYAHKITSKGYFFNSFAPWARHCLHMIKLHGVPFPVEDLSPLDITSRLKDFFISHATILFTRSHISERSGNLKLRPVYAMDTLFLHIECMLTFPLHVLSRSVKSSLMYSLETIRGGCAYMDQFALNYNSFLCIDWSSFDQRMPWIIVDLFFTIFLPSLIIINHGYQPTAEYPTYPGLTPDKMFSRCYNLISFLRLWYFNCVFCTADGFAYVRNFCGIASGMLNTQYLDSFCNLFLCIHALYHFGSTTEEILEIMFFVMGDDNVILTHWSLPKAYAFATFLENHSLTRFGMVLSPTKSIITRLRSRIEMLGYTCNNGIPTRNLDKLVAQLCFPEHGYADKHMSSRAIGIAWASAGMNRSFFNLCRDVYLTFLPYSVPPDEFEKEQILKYLPGMFKMLDDPLKTILLSRFPTIDEVQQRFSTWQGELHFSTKWNTAHFLTPPGVTPPDSITMSEYMEQHSLIFKDVEHLFT